MTFARMLQQGWDTDFVAFLQAQQVDVKVSDVKLLYRCWVSAQMRMRSKVAAEIHGIKVEPPKGEPCYFGHKRYGGAICAVCGDGQ